MENVIKLDTLKGELNFRLDFESVIKLEERHGHQAVLDMFNELTEIRGKSFTKSVLEILSGCCIDKELDCDGLKSILTPDYPTMLVMDEVSSKLLFGFLGGSEESTEQEKKV